MASEPERIEEVRKYIEATITEIDSHTEDMEKLFIFLILKNTKNILRLSISYSYRKKNG